MVDDARTTALLILNTLDREHKTLDDILNEVLGTRNRLKRRDRALLHALVHGVLRWRGRLDWIIENFSKTRLHRIDPPVLNILRLGLFQIVYLDRIPVSAAVNTSVEMTKSFAPTWVVRYVNGLLRNAAKGYQNVSYPDFRKDPVSALAAEKSFPKWLIKRWLERFDPQETDQICDAINSIPPITIRANTLTTTRRLLIESLMDVAPNAEPTPFAPDGVRFSHPKIPIHEMAAFQEGFFQVQDEAAQLVTLLLNPQPGETVLDACAGLGGKTGHIAQMMKNRGRITALDKNEQKCLKLASEMNRLGVTIVAAHSHDLDTPLGPGDFRRFDRILLDAPCSGLGVLRRNPDAKWSIEKQNLMSFQQRQARFLDHLADLVKHNGIVVYAVCSTEPEESDAVVKVFLNKRQDFVIEKIHEGLPVEARALVNSKGCLQTSPHLNHMDGFFAACLRRLK